MRKFKECPLCSSSGFIKYGKYNKIQRYKCKNQLCNKTFSDCTNTIWYNSKKNYRSLVSILQINVLWKDNT
ncbi:MULTISPECIES: transposase [Clostridium]|uniref:Transposase n=1 Tax=Clostridium nitritogenes TaxID=83340 RepID=A0ABN1LHH4_9CLOT